MIADIHTCKLSTTGNDHLLFFFEIFFLIIFLIIFKLLKQIYGTNIQKKKLIKSGWLTNVLLFLWFTLYCNYTHNIDRSFATEVLYSKLHLLVLWETNVAQWNIIKIVYHKCFWRSGESCLMYMWPLTLLHICMKKYIHWWGKFQIIKFTTLSSN